MSKIKTLNCPECGNVGKPGDGFEVVELNQMNDNGTLRDIYCCDECIALLEVFYELKFLGIKNFEERVVI